MKTMGRMSHKALEMRGTAKLAIGKRTGDRKLAAKGRGERTVGQLKQMGDDMKRAAHSAKRALSR